MGYANTTVILFGVELSNEQAKKIYEERLEDTEEGNFPYEPEDCITTEVMYTHHEKPVYKERNIPQMLADGADSRIDNMVYSDDSNRHVIGVHLASRGYACDDKIEDFLTPSEKAISNFNKYILPILNEENIETKPKIIIFSQVW